jgi:hypothetical protein
MEIPNVRAHKIISEDFFLFSNSIVDDVKHFIYLHVDATVSETGGTNEDIRRRLGHARLAYNKLKSVWNNSQFGRKTKMKLLKSNVLSVLLYGSETLKMTKGDEKIL